MTLRINACWGLGGSNVLSGPALPQGRKRVSQGETITGITPCLVPGA